MLGRNSGSRLFDSFNYAFLLLLGLLAVVEGQELFVILFMEGQEFVARLGICCASYGIGQHLHGFFRVQYCHLEADVHGFTVAFASPVRRSM